MPQPLSHENRLRIVRLFLNKWRAKDIAREIGCNTSTIYHVKDNLLNYGSVYKPQTRPKGRPTKIPDSAKDAVEAFLKEHPEAQQKDVRLFLSMECGVEVHQSSISRLLKGDCQYGKKGMAPDHSPQKRRKTQLGQPSPGRPFCSQAQGDHFSAEQPISGPPGPAPIQDPPGQHPAAQSPSVQFPPHQYPHPPTQHSPILHPPEQYPMLADSGRHLFNDMQPRYVPAQQDTAGTVEQHLQPT
ncbi:MAG: hypothetical protein Q9170_005624 [Blastenia crenularia]